MTPLEEAMGLGKFLKTLFKPEYKTIDPSHAKAKCVEIVKKIVLPLGGKIVKTKDKTTNEVTDLIFTVAFKGEKFLLHASVHYHDSNFMLDLWDLSHENLVDILCQGPIEGEYALRGLGKSRLKKWVE